MQGKYWTVVRWILDRKNGVVCQPWDNCPNVGDHVMEMLQYKHPTSQTTLSDSLDDYNGPPPRQIFFYLKTNMMTVIVRHISSGAGPGVTYSVIL